MHAFIETQKEWLRNVPAFRPGDTLRVNVRVKEGEKERVQAFEGVCISRRGSGVSGFQRDGNHLTFLSEFQDQGLRGPIDNLDVGLLVGGDPVGRC